MPKRTPLMAVGCNDLYSQEGQTSAPLKILLIREGIPGLGWADFDEDIVLDQEQGNAIIQKFIEQGNDVPIDYHHATVDDDADKAPAAGWIKKLSYMPGEGLWAEVEWTDVARMEIEGKQYRYFSPVIYYDKKTKKIDQLQSVALTNTPRTKHQKALMAASLGVHFDERDTDMADKASAEVQAAADALRAALTTAGVQVKADATFAELLAAHKTYVESATALASAANDTLSKVATKLGAGDTKLESLIGKIDPLITDRVPVAEYTKLGEQVKALQAAESKRTADSLVAKAITEGKLNPNDAAQMTWAKAEAENPERFAAWEKSAPKVVPVGTLTTGTTLDTGDSGSRASSIARAKAEYGEQRTKVPGVSEWAYVNAALGMEGHDLLTADEKKALKG